MFLLAVDTSTAQVSAAIVRVGDDASTSPVASRETLAPNRHGELLAEAIHDVFNEAHVGWDEITAIAAGLGPGPFTGLRVGVMTAAAIADARRVPSYGVCSLDAIAQMHSPGRVLVCSDARRKQVYWARYHDGRRVEGPEIGPPVDVAAHNAAQVDRAVGAGSVLHREAFAGLVVVETDAYPCAAEVASLAAERAVAHAPSETLEPMYLRRPDAVPPGAPKAVTPA
ncbi:MAG TPA: tRNA (adenosine(37)-N6)-threonylcarbamoyltransferase complex dimerization subunit type 1 TsaB [Mycobacteriales bacterium]|nr:tRNA (adenosine(37)-N6)-threonylcarbamoyltransferase complex dimerization subunit type 1 TsaB [Mycobacteriales bacterium]